jgi:hypothetical protein
MQQFPTVNNHSLHSTIAEKLQKYRPTDPKEEPVRIWQLNADYIIPLVLSTAPIMQDRLHEDLKLLDLGRGLYSIF